MTVPNTNPDAPRAGGETSERDPAHLLATLNAIGIVDLLSALFDGAQAMREKARRDDHEDIDATYFLEGADILDALHAALPPLLGRHRDGERIQQAFLAGVEHIAGADGCGAREGLAARVYAQADYDREIL